MFLFLLFDIEPLVYVILDRPLRPFVKKERCSLLRYLRYLFIATTGDSFLFRDLGSVCINCVLFCQTVINEQTGFLVHLMMHICL